ncbi:non-specific DNA-binding protein Dps, partial [human gut metagenome]
MPDEAVKLVLESLGHLIGEERKLLAEASEAGDEATVALMSDYLREQEKLVWTLVASSDCDCASDCLTEV